MTVYRIYFSEKDSNHLRGRDAPKGLPDAEAVDFSRSVVDKPWGYEYLAHRTPYAHCWCLFIKHNELTSMHSHPNKKTGLLVLEGTAAFSTLNTTIHLKPLDSVVIDTGVFHSTRALSAEGARLIEIETPPLKHDLIRLRDDYGRAGTLYEGRDHMREALNVNGYARLPELAEPGYEERAFCGHTLCIHKLRGSYSARDEELLRQSELIVFLEGSIHSRRGQLLHSVADIVPRSEFLNNLNSHVLWDLTLLLVKTPT